MFPWIQVSLVIPKNMIVRKRFSHLRFTTFLVEAECCPTF